MDSDLSGVFRRLAGALNRVGERSEEIGAALSDRERAALMADLEEVVGLFYSIGPRATALLEAIEARAARALGPDWDREPMPAGSTLSARRRQYVARGQ